MSTATESVSTGAWVNVEDELPPLGVKVRVDGDYIAPGSGHPLAHLCNCSFHKGEHFESNQWRGMVAIRRWWKETPAATTSDERPSDENAKVIQEAA